MGAPERRLSAPHQAVVEQLQAESAAQGAIVQATAWLDMLMAFAKDS